MGLWLVLRLHIKDTNGNGYIFTVWLLFTHCVERSKRKKNPQHSNICSWYWFDTDWNSWVGCLWYCDNREPSILFKYKFFYVWFAVLCVTQGALVPRKSAYTAWRNKNKNKSNGHRNKLCPLFRRFLVCTQCGGMLQYRELKKKICFV